MKLTKDTKRAAGVPAPMPEALRSYIEQLPPATVNGSRELLRRAWAKALRNIQTYGWVGAVNASAEIRKRFGLTIEPSEFPNPHGGDGEPDFVRGKDDGEAPRHYTDTGDVIPF